MLTNSRSWLIVVGLCLALAACSGSNVAVPSGEEALPLDEAAALEDDDAVDPVERTVPTNAEPEGGAGSFGSTAVCAAAGNVLNPEPKSRHLGPNFSLAPNTPKSFDCTIANTNQHVIELEFSGVDAADVKIEITTGPGAGTVSTDSANTKRITVTPSSTGTWKITVRNLSETTSSDVGVLIWQPGGCTDCATQEPAKEPEATPTTLPPTATK